MLEALTKAQGEPLTAGQVASSTGLGRPSVSTTLSKLARSGDVIKAQRGYAIAAAASGPAADPSPEMSRAPEPTELERSVLAGRVSREEGKG